MTIQYAIMEWARLISRIIEATAPWVAGGDVASVRRIGDIFDKALISRSVLTDAERELQRRIDLESDARRIASELSSVNDTDTRVRIRELFRNL